MLGVAVIWRNTGSGFHFDGLPKDALPSNWLDADTTATPILLELGPDPIIAPQSVTLTNTRLAGAVWRVQTDGLRPFTVQPVVDGEAQSGSSHCGHCTDRRPESHRVADPQC
jgi:general secretion pathway protein H